jgi:hypothetical protein
LLGYGSLAAVGNPNKAWQYVEDLMYIRRGEILRGVGKSTEVGQQKIVAGA